MTVASNDRAGKAYREVLRKAHQQYLAAGGDPKKWETSKEHDAACARADNAALLAV